MWHRDGLGDDNYILLNTTAVRNGSTDWFQDSTQQLLHHILEVQAMSGFHIVLLMLRDTQGIGIYFGNGANNGLFIFILVSRFAWLMIKCSLGHVENWRYLG